METIKILEEGFRDVFDDDKVAIFPEMTADDYEEWDSLTHIQFIVAVEKKFGVKFSMSETQKLKNIGEFVTLIDAKLKG